MKKPSKNNNLLTQSNRQHVMLLYESEPDRNAAAINCINEGLALGQFCVYALVEAHNKDFLSYLTSQIHNYEHQVREGNLLIVNMKPFYDAALKSDLTPFVNFKKRVEDALKNRIAQGKGDKALIVADCADNLSKNKRFDECVTVETWWQNAYTEWMQNNQDISIICPHPASVLKHDPHIREGNSIANVHSLTLDVELFARPATGSTLADNVNKLQQQQENKLLRILVVEPEHDIQSVYKLYLRSLPVDVIIAPDGKSCLEHILTPHSKEKAFDIIIIDTHLEDANAVHIIKKVLEEKPDQHIIVTTTSDAEVIRDSLDSQLSGSKRKKIDMLAKPFKFSDLLARVRYGRQPLSQTK